MELTFIGVVQVCFGLALFLAGTMEAMFAFVLVSSLFGGSAAAVLPALGGSSIPPAQFALAFAAVRVTVPGSGQMKALGIAARENLWLIAFVAYGVLAAYVAPRLFAGQVEVTPLRGRTEARYSSMSAYIFATRSLTFTAQNITTSVYLIGTLLMALVSHIVCSRPRGPAVMVKTMAAVGTVHGLLGFAGLAVAGTPAERILALFRNGSYAQLDHAWRGFVRMTGIWPEASSFAAFGFVWMVFLAECWLRRIEGRWTGPAAAILLLALVFSTSGSAYVGLAAYAAVLVLRIMAFPGSIPADRLLWMLCGVLSIVVVGCALVIRDSRLAVQFAELIGHMTFGKTDSLSGMQRAFWARQGLDAFVATSGIGIGPGSFRSSSLITAIVGCMGVVGIVTFAGHLLFAFKPTRLSTYVAHPDQPAGLGGAAAWAMVMGVGLAAIALPTCDPGTDFAILSGCALALRRRTGPATALRQHTHHRTVSPAINGANR